MVRHRGDAVTCPLCGGRFDRFKAAWNRPNALCWRCGSHERHRAQWLLFTRRPELLRDPRSLLHFAPEWTMRERLAPIAAERGIRYLTADLNPAGVDLELDLQRLALPDACFEAVMCSHVLEHVPDDATAMRELRRVTAPGGWCLVMVPLAVDRTETYEDTSVVTPEGRRREFSRTTTCACTPPTSRTASRLPASRSRRSARHGPRARRRGARRPAARRLDLPLR